MPRTLLALAALFILLPACGSGDGPDRGVTAEPSKTDARAEATARTADAEVRLSEATTDDTEDETPEATATPDWGSPAPPASGAINVAGAGNPESPVSGVGICGELKSALLAMRANAYDFELYASDAVIQELRANTVFRDPETGQSTPEDVAAWAEADHPGTCSLSAGGDAWYRLTLKPLTGGRGDYATSIAVTSSYAEGGP